MKLIKIITFTSIAFFSINSFANAGDKQVDDQCFVAYSQAAGRCNTEHEDDEKAFDRCVAREKAGLVRCCKKGGTKKCADDAKPEATSGKKVVNKKPRPFASKVPQKTVDDQCFVAYSQAAGRCNTDHGEEDDVAFSACLKQGKADLAKCCEKGGSKTCADDAASTQNEQNSHAHEIGF